MADHVTTVVEQWKSLRPELDLVGMAVFGRISRLSRVADLRRAAVLERYGLQTGDVDVLAPLFRHGGDGLRPLELRRAMMIGSGTLTARLDRLESSGLLARHPDKADRRGRLIHLTPEGERLVPDVVADLLEVENDMLAELPPSVRNRLSSDLGRLMTNLEADSR